MTTSYFGSCSPSSRPALLPDLHPPHSAIWRASSPHSSYAFRSSSPNALSLFTPNHAICVHGYAVLRSPFSLSSSCSSILHYMLKHYASSGQLPIDHLDGNFTIVLFDIQNDRIVIYRNLVSTAFTYYTYSGGRFLFSNNLASLAFAFEHPPAVNQACLPAFFLFRYVPGRETLFRDIYRLLPGQQICFQRSTVELTSPEPLCPFSLPSPPTDDLSANLEENLSAVLSDTYSAYPQSATLLSGGVDSSLIQALCNHTSGSTPRPLRSFSVALDHPLTCPDTDYALSASAVLHTDHVLISARDPYLSYLWETIASSAEPPHHVQSAYFPLLARAMLRRGVSAGLCGQGADALFGLGCQVALDTASTLRTLFPHPSLLQLGRRVASLLRFPSLPDYFQLATILSDSSSWLHPMNQVGTFTDWDLLQRSFGSRAISDALAQRRSSLDDYQVSGTISERVHACDFLSDSTDTAALWTTFFNAQGASLFFPFLDSRLIRFVFGLSPSHRFSYRRPKEHLKQLLARHVPRDLAYRKKLAFGQPIFEWMAPGGQLRPWLEQLGHYDFLSPALRDTALARSNWFLYSLLCFDLWHRLFIERSLPLSYQEHISTHSPGRRLVPTH